MTPRLHLGIHAHDGDGGHLSRAMAVARAWDGRVTILSSQPPETLGGSGLDVVVLPEVAPEEPAGVRTPAPLHHAPLGDGGLRDSMGRIAGWIRAGRPDVVLVDDSVEVALLCRLHGVPTALVALPGDGEDPARELGREVADLVVAPWGEPGDRDGAVHVGLVSRFDDRPRRFGRCGDDTVRVVVAADGPTSWEAHLDELRAALPAGHRLDVLGATGMPAVPDPWTVLVGADIVVASASTDLVADVAAAGVPLVAVAGDDHEQRVHAAALGEEWGVPVARGWADDLASLVAAARRAGPRHLSDRQGASRTAAALAKLAERGRP